MSKTIDELPAATSLLTTDEFPVWSGAATRKATFALLPFLPSGIGASAETVQSALRDLRAGISTDTIYSRFYRTDNTFNGTVDHGTIVGYNVTGFGQIESAAANSAMMMFEMDYNDGTRHMIEWHIDMAAAGQSFKRPINIAYYTTGADANKVVAISFASDKDIDLTAASGDIELNGSTLTLSGVAEHTGTFLISSRLFLTTNVTDSSSKIEIGSGDSVAGTRTNIRWRNGGFAAPSNANANSNGDKTVFWNAADAKYASGVTDQGEWFWQHHRPSGSAAVTSFLWHGGIAANTAEKMRLDGNGNLGLGTAAWGTNAVTVFGIKSGTAPTTGPADTVQLYSSDNSAGNTIPSFFCEGTEVIATGQADSASSVRVKMRINGTVVTLLAI